MSLMKDNSTFNGNSLSVTDSEGSLTLQDLNDEEVRRRLAPMIYLGLLILIGLPGNITVLVVYATKFKQSTHRTFILALAAIDTVACVVCMPFEIVEMNFQYTFYAEAACKFFRFNNTFIALSSIFVLLFLSIDRYQRVCHPFGRHMTIRVSYILCGGALSLGILFSWPVLFLLGTRHVELRMNITGFDCSTSDVFRKTKLPFIHSGVLFVLFIIMIVTLIVLYSLIGRKVMKHASFKNKKSAYKSSPNSSTSTKSTSVSDSNSTGNDRIEMVSRQTEKDDEEESDKKVNSHPTLAPSNQIRSERANPTRRITKIAFMISLTFILSYLPHLILTVMTAVKGGFVAKPGPVVSALLPIVTRSIFINNVANAFIYGFYDRHFRENVKIGLKELFRCK